MEYTKSKFLLELENYFNNFPDYTVGQCLHSLVRIMGDRDSLYSATDEEVIEQLERTQFIETNN